MYQMKSKHLALQKEMHCKQNAEHATSNLATYDFKIKIDKCYTHSRKPDKNRRLKISLHVLCILEKKKKETYVLDMHQRDSQ